MVSSVLQENELIEGIVEGRDGTVEPLSLLWTPIILLNFHKNIEIIFDAFSKKKRIKNF